MDYINNGVNPFAVLTAVVAPAILTNACSVGADVGPSLEDRDKEGPTPTTRGRRWCRASTQIVGCGRGS